MTSFITVRDKENNRDVSLNPHYIEQMFEINHYEGTKETAIVTNRGHWIYTRESVNDIMQLIWAVERGYE